MKVTGRTNHGSNSFHDEIFPFHWSYVHQGRLLCQNGPYRMAIVSRIKFKKFGIHIVTVCTIKNKHHSVNLSVHLLTLFIEFVRTIFYIQLQYLQTHWKPGLIQLQIFSAAKIQLATCPATHQISEETCNLQEQDEGQEPSSADQSILFVLFCLHQRKNNLGS